jgi:hypothetical protein
MAALSTNQVHTLLAAVVPAKDHVVVLGAFPADYLPIEMHNGVLYAFGMDIPRHSAVLDKHKNYCFVLNVDTEGEPGEHWLGFFYEGNRNGRNLYYFDSFGMAVEMYTNVAKALDDHGLKYSCFAANRVPLQSFTSSVCGQYAIVFLAWRARHMNEDVRMFGYDLCHRGNTGDARDHIILSTLASLVARAVVHSGITHTKHKPQTCTHRHNLFKANAAK